MRFCYSRLFRLTAGVMNNLIDGFPHVQLKSMRSWNREIMRLRAMMVVRRAVAAARYGHYPADAVYTVGSTRWVKIEKLFESHLRFQTDQAELDLADQPALDLYDFFLVLCSAKRRDNTSRLEFFGVPEGVVVHHQSMPGTWVSAPIANR